MEGDALDPTDTLTPSTFACPAKAFTRELKRLAVPAYPALIAAFRFDGASASICLWHLAGTRGARWWWQSRWVCRSGVWVRPAEGGREVEASWETPVSVRNAIVRSEERFSQFETRAAAHSRLVLAAGRRLVSGTPRATKGGIARLLFDDAAEHVRDPAIDLALADLGAWMQHPVLDPCGTCQVLRIEAAMALGADDGSDERDVQLLACLCCGGRRIALYEESRRGAGARFHHRMNDGRCASELSECLEACASPRAPACRCPGHVRARRAVHERWMAGACEHLPAGRLSR